MISPAPDRSAEPAAAPRAGVKALLALPPLQLGEAVAVYQSDCSTPATEFALGQSLCVKVTGGPLGLRPTQVLRRISIVNPSGYVVSKTSLTEDPQEITLTLPGTATSIFGGDTVDNRGEWQVLSSSTATGAVKASATFTVRDAAQPVADLAILKTVAGSAEVAAGSSVSFSVIVVNFGPDDAAAVNIIDEVPANMTFVSADVSGSGFTCQTAGSPTTTTCTAPTLAAGTKTKITLTYTVDTGVPVKTLIVNRADVTTTTVQRSIRDNISRAAVTVTDTAAGGASCTLTCPADRIVTANATEAGQPGAFVSYSAAGVSGDCGAVTNDPASGSFLTVGTHTITSTSESGPSCTFTVTVLDSAAPTINCPADITVTDTDNSDDETVNPGTPTFTATGGGTVTGVRSDSTPAETDDDGNVITPAAPVPLTAPYPVGTTGILWTVTGSAGRTASCTQKIIVNPGACAGDDEDPTITAPADITVGTGAVNTGCAVALDDELGQAEVDDNCSAGVTISGIPAGNAFAPGTYTLTYTATDGSGNTATDTQVVTVIDNTPPAIEAPADASYTCPSEVPAANPSQATRGEVLDENGNPLPPGPPFENCGTPLVTVVDTDNAGAGSASNPRIITRTYTATDAAGNSASDSQTITVADGTAPTIALNDPTPQVVECHTSYTERGATATDNCPATSFAATPSGTVNVNVPGTYTVTYNATDAAGNAATPVTRTVTVVDTTPPVMSCPADIVVYLPLNSTAVSMPVSFSAPTATDSCDASVPVTASHAPGSVFNVGTTTVSASATDDSLNSSSCSFTVTVLYNFTGFFAPVDNAPTVNVVKAGSGIPVKFSLSGNKGLAIFAANSPSSGLIPCDAAAPVDPIEETVTAGGSSLNYDAATDRYNYVWKSDKDWANTCRQLIVTLNDGSVHTANFKFTK